MAANSQRPLMIAFRMAELETAQPFTILVGASMKSTLHNFFDNERFSIPNRSNPIFAFGPTINAFSSIRC